MKTDTDELGHMPIHGKTFKINFHNQLTDDLETWYEACGTRVLPRLFK